MALPKFLQELDALNVELNKFCLQDNSKIQEALAIEYIYESNRIEGNSLTLQETQLIIEKGLTIGGKALKEHLEAINHKEAFDFISELVKKETVLDERRLKQIHAIMLKSIDRENGGVYRKAPVLISGSTHTPPQPYMLQKLMEEYFQFYEESRKSMHPVVLAAEMHERLVTIHPFIDGNGRTSRLVMNLILLQHGYPIANIRGDSESRLKYYNALENSREDNKTAFVELIADSVKQMIERLLSLTK